MAYRNDSEARAALATAQAPRARPLLARIEVASPCSKRWEDLMTTGDARIRACGGCRQHVYDLSNMTTEEAERLILDTDHTACVRYFERADGTILLADCTVGGRRRTALRVAAAGVVSALAVAGAALAMSRPPPPLPDLEISETLGNLRPDDPPPPEVAESPDVPPPSEAVATP